MKALRQQIGLMAPPRPRVDLRRVRRRKELVATPFTVRACAKDEDFCRSELRRHSRRLIESELFGHYKGSFAGAAADKEGKFQKADGGTLFLDEVGDMSLKTQSKSPANARRAALSLRWAATKHHRGCSRDRLNK